MRNALRNRRVSELMSFTHGGIKFTGHVSYSQDGIALETFLDGGKVGTPVSSASRDSAVAVSLALQFGAPLETIRAAMTRNEDGTAAGPMGHLLDLISDVQP